MNAKPSFLKYDRFTRSHLKESNGEHTGSEAEKLAADNAGRGGTGVWLDRGRWSRHGGICLNLTIGNLGNGAASWCLDLTVGNLGHWGASWCLDLAVSCP